MPKVLPPILPKEPEVSLVTSATQMSGELDDVWATGLHFRDDLCIPSGGWPRCAPGNIDDKVFGGTGVAQAPFPEFQPFTIYAGFECLSRTPVDEMAAAGRAALKAKMPFAVARELWTGDLSGSVSLMSSAVAIGPSAVPAWVAAQALLSNFEDCSQSGSAVLHVPSILINSIMDRGLAERVGNRIIWKATGNVIVPGPGYPNGPGNWGPLSNSNVILPAATGQAWMYVTGPIELAFGPDWEQASNDGPTFARQNKRMFLAERDVIFRFPPCCAQAALVSISS